jgi:hypothetical protein
MNLREYLSTVANSRATDWLIIFQPTYRHRFTEQFNSEGEKIRTDVDQHPVMFTYRHDVSITLYFGLVEKGNYALPANHPLGSENARTVILDCFADGRLVHRETLLKADRQRCILPMPETWPEGPVKIPQTKAKLARLIHELAGPPTDFDEYFGAARMVVVDAPWP